jgi:prostaglandin-E synthase 1
MPSLATNPAFIAYAVTLIVLSLDLLLLWAYSGAVRGRAKATPNVEDARGSNRLVEIEPPEIARVLRVHANAAANIVPFAILGLVYVLAGAPVMAASIVFGVFALARIAHAFAYLGGKQPWRTISFSVGALSTLVLMGLIVRSLIVAA